MNPRDLVQQYLSQVNLMQLATSHDDVPWACTVHFCADSDLNIYWMSTKTRQHSQHIAQNPNVAAAILIHENTPEEPHVIGVSLSGQASLVESKYQVEIHEQYLLKFSDRKDLIERLTAGENPHVFYRLTPEKITIFDTKDFPDNPRQEVDL